MANRNKRSFVQIDPSVNDDDIFSVPRRDPPRAQKGPTPPPPPPPPPLSSTEAAIEALRSSVEEQRSKSVFACGGKVPVVVVPSTTSSSSLKGTRKKSSRTSRTRSRSRDDAGTFSSPPIDLRWDALAGAEEEDVPSKRTKLVLPLEPQTGGNLAQLLKDTQPATFGRGGEDVYDEQYRKASKMDPTRFSSTFNPYTLGIVDEIAQALLPSAVGSEYTRAVRAELYMLNIYSGPSGKFKAHVDTPRAADQFGSLVVCLPLEHEGGALEVRHEGNSVAFDWGKAGKSSGKSGKKGEGGAFIQWAAFYSDCEHEVLEVTSGHRLTLTYNLYAVRGNGLLAGHCQSFDAATLPLYKQVVGILKDESFMTEGGCLGFYCQHAYPHTSTVSCLPDTLKGIDMMLYETFRAFGYPLYLRPVLADPFTAQLLKYYPPDDEETKEKIRLHIGGSLRFQKAQASQIEYYDAFQEVMEDFETGGDGGGRRFRESEIIWATSPKHQEAQFSYAAYGNDATSEVLYSNCAIIVEIPAWAQRASAVAVSG